MPNAEPLGTLARGWAQTYITIAPVVSEELWDHFVMTRYPSIGAYENLFKTDEWIEASRLRRAVSG